MGDQLLKNIGNKLGQVFEEGLISRFSSDHFLVLTNTQNLIERIQEIHEFVHEYQRGMRMEIKAGIYMLEDHISWIIWMKRWRRDGSRYSISRWFVH